MDALSVISLDQAKDHLVVDFDDYDAQITGIIKTAIAMVQQYTGYYLFPQTKTYPVTSTRVGITDFPLQITGITDAQGNQVPSFNIQITQGALTTYISTWAFYACENGTAIIIANVGYNTVDSIPQPLIGAAYKIITYLFENKDAYAATLPYDIQLLLNQWRRSPSI